MKARITLGKKNKTFFVWKLCRDTKKACALSSPIAGRDTEPPNDVKKARKKRQKCSQKATKKHHKNSPKNVKNHQKNTKNSHKDVAQKVAKICKNEHKNLPKTHAKKL